MNLHIHVIWDMNDDGAVSEYVVNNYVATSSENPYPDVVITPKGMALRRISRPFFTANSDDNEGVHINYKPASVVRLDDNGDNTAIAYEIDMPTLVNRNA